MIDLGSPSCFLLEPYWRGGSAAWPRWWEALAASYCVHKPLEGFISLGVTVPTPRKRSSFDCLSSYYLLGKLVLISLTFITSFYFLKSEVFYFLPICQFIILFYSHVIEREFTYHPVHPFKVYNAEVFSVVIYMQPSPQSFWHMSIISKRNPIPVAFIPCFPLLTPRQPLIFVSVTCLFWRLRRSGTTQNVVLVTFTSRHVFMAHPRCPMHLCFLYFCLIVK